MSKKNLARSVIEGGRARYNKFQRYHSHAVARAAEHRATRQLISGADADDAVFEPLSPVYQGFRDKLGPARRFLRSQVGRPWDKVQSELFARFDTRTTAGRHILYCHLLREVERQRVTPYDRFYVSAHGILRMNPERRRPHSRFEWLPEPEHVVDAWLAKRRVGWHDTKAFWLTATPSGRYRQDRPLTAEEQARYLTFPRWFRERVETLEGES